MSKSGRFRTRRQRRQFKMKFKNKGGVRSHAKVGGRTGSVLSKRLKQGAVNL